MNFIFSAPFLVGAVVGAILYHFWMMRSARKTMG